MSLDLDDGAVKMFLFTHWSIDPHSQLPAIDARLAEGGNHVSPARFHSAPAVWKQNQWHIRRRRIGQSLHTPLFPRILDLSTYLRRISWTCLLVSQGTMLPRMNPHS